MPEKLLVVVHKVWHIYYSKLFPHHSVYKLVQFFIKILYLQLHASNEVTLSPYEINELKAYHQINKCLFLFVNEFGSTVM